MLGGSSITYYIKEVIVKKLSFGFCFVASMVLSGQSSASLLSLNEAVSFNLITRGDATLIDADSQGIIAIGGNAIVNHYDVGTLGGTDKTAIQVDGNLNASGDQIIKGNAIVGGTYTNSSGSAWDSPIASWCCTISTSGGINIADTMDELQALSLMLASTPSNTSTSLSYSSLSFTPAEISSDFYLSDISTAQFNDATDFVASSADIFSLDDYLIINVSGVNIDLHSIGFPGYPGTLPNSSNILFNFFEADSIALDNGAFYGHILAPSADLRFTKGLITGSIFVDSFYSDAGAQLNSSGSFDLQMRLVEPEVEVRDVSAPASIGLFALALIFLARQRKVNLASMQLRTL